MGQCQRARTSKNIMVIGLKIVEEKSEAKICNMKFATFLTSFQANSTPL
jgi:hypothetical protein